MNERLKALIEAVKSTELGGIRCDDVNGKNWFDERSELLRLQAVKDALGVCAHGILLPHPCGMCDHEKWNELRVNRMTAEAQKIRLELIRKTYDRETLAKEMTDKIKKLRDWCDATDNGEERSLPSIVRDLDEILELNSDKAEARLEQQPPQTQWAKDTATVVNRANEETIKRMEERIRELETCIAEHFASHDECSFSILNRVCDGCRCERMEK